MKKVSDIKRLSLIANTLREDIIKMLVKAGSGHSAGPLGMADVFAVLYFNVLNHNPENPRWKDRDRLVLSNGHICPVLYAALAESGYFPKKEILTLRKLGTKLQGHPHNLSLEGIETSSGPLGQGISQAVGMAIAGKMDSKKYRVYCIVSDGELNEGQTWEALMLASKHQLDNLCFVVDRNHIQIDGFTEDIMPIEPLKEKLEAFGLQVIEINGNNLQQIIDAFENSKAITGKPVIVIAHTIPGKGVSFMENNFEWHGKAPNLDEAKEALEELENERAHIGKSQEPKA